MNIDDDKVAKSVTFTSGGDQLTVKANKDIVLSAGVYGSAHLLLKSGIGPRQQLEAHQVSQCFV